MSLQASIGMLKQPDKRGLVMSRWNSGTFEELRSRSAKQAVKRLIRRFQARSPAESLQR